MLQEAAETGDLEALVRRPRSLAEVNLAAGGGALEQVGRLLAERQRS